MTTYLGEISQEVAGSAIAIDASGNERIDTQIDDGGEDNFHATILFNISSLTATWVSAGSGPAILATRTHRQDTIPSLSYGSMFTTP